jgi:hypothetical protein
MLKQPHYIGTPQGCGITNHAVSVLHGRSHWSPVCPTQVFDRQAALQLLLAKETRLLQTLDRLRINARAENGAAHARRLLGHLASPQMWTLRNGGRVLVHTPGTVRAAELSQLHAGLVLAGLPLAERLDLLLHVKWALASAVTSGCRIARELAQLCDREADLLNRHVILSHYH